MKAYFVVLNEMRTSVVPSQVLAPARAWAAALGIEPHVVFRSDESGAVQRLLRVGGRVPGLEQQLVAFAQRQAKRLGEADDHLPARRRTAAFDEAEVPLGGPGPQGQLKLADPAGRATFLQRGREVHASQL